MITAPSFTAPAPTSLAPDPLGTQSVNMALYRSVFPGINNVAQYIRVYSALSWMVLKIDEAAVARGATQEEALEISTRGTEKMELLLTWSNTLNGVDGMPGSRRLWPTDPARKVELRFDVLMGEEQDKAVKAGKVDIDFSNSARFLSAPEYRPSAVNGLRFLAVTGIAGMWELTKGGMNLAAAFQAMLDKSRHPLADWLADPTATTITQAEVKALWNPVLNVREVTVDEREAFLAHYFPLPDASPSVPRWRHRHKGLTLALRAIETAESNFEASEGFVPVDAIRHTMGSRLAPNGWELADETLEDIAGYWTSLQYRQYLKLALETLFRATEFVVHNAVLGNRAREVTAISAAVGAYASAGLPTDVKLADVASRLRGSLLRGEESLYRSGMRVPALDMKTRMAALSSAGWSIRLASSKGIDAVYAALQAASALACEALVYCALDATVWRDRQGFRMTVDGDRLPLTELVQLFADFSNASPAEFVAQVVRDYVVNLHFRVVRERTEWERNPRDRYRFIMGDHGLERNLNTERDLINIDIMSDLLHRALNLMARSGLLEQRGPQGNENEFRLTEAGRIRASQTLEMA